MMCVSYDTNIIFLLTFGRTSYDFCCCFSLTLLYLSHFFPVVPSITAVDEEVSVVQIESDVRTDVEEQMGMAPSTYIDIGPIQNNEGEQVTPEHERDDVEMNRGLDGNRSVQEHDVLETPRTKKRKSPAELVRPILPSCSCNRKYLDRIPEERHIDSQ